MKPFYVPLFLKHTICAFYFNVFWSIISNPFLVRSLIYIPRPHGTCRYLYVSHLSRRVETIVPFYVHLFLSLWAKIPLFIYAIIKTTRLMGNRLTVLQFCDSNSNNYYVYGLVLMSLRLSGNVLRVKFYVLCI